MGIQESNEGKKFGLWTLISKIDRLRWLADCECGTRKIVHGANVIYGKSKSCGCVRNLATSERSGSHRLSKTPIHNLWIKIRQRCSNPSTDNFSYYGGRGIKVCDRWQNFDFFYEDMGDIPQGHSIDRIDPNGNYEPENCRWATKTTQARNTRANHFVEHCGHRLTLAEWGEIKGINPISILKRLRRGWSASDAIEQPSGTKLVPYSRKAKSA